MNSESTVRDMGPSARSIVLLCVASAFVAFAVAMAGPRLLQRERSPRFAVVDLAAIVRQQQESSVAQLASGAVDARARAAAMARAQEFGKRLDREAVELSKECGCVLLMREAVVSGQLDDMTPVLVARLAGKR